MRWREATSITFYYDRAVDEWPCEVRLSEDRDELVITYEGDAGYTVYRGKVDERGTYRLRSKEGMAELVFINEEELVGTWSEITDEGRMEGVWKVDLGELDASAASEA